MIKHRLAPVPLAVLAVRKRRTLRLPRPLSAAIATTVPPLVAASAPRSRARHVAVWAAHMWAYKTAYEMPYDVKRKLRRRVNVGWPIRVDRVLGFGRPPGERLQRALRRPPRLTPLDKALTAFYATWELEPHAVLAWVLLRHEDRFARAALRLAATFDLTLLGYALAPTAPPWFASERRGRLGRRVRRVTVEVQRRVVKGKRLPTLKHVEGANPWAAIPSDHFATAAMTAMLASEIDPRAGAAAAGYAGLLGFALVYLGEHYVVDLLLGLALAEGVRRAEPFVSPLLRGVDETWKRIEPRS